MTMTQILKLRKQRIYVFTCIEIETEVPGEDLEKYCKNEIQKRNLTKISHFQSPDCLPIRDARLASTDWSVGW